MLAVELSSFQLHWTSTVALHAGALLNLAPDHLDWHGSMADYAADKAKIWRGGALPVVNADDPLVVELARPRAAGPSGSRSATRRPASSVSGRRHPARPRTRRRHCSAGVRARRRRRRARRPAPHNLANALAAAALARSLHHAGLLSVPADAVRAGLRAVDPGAHRIAHVATVDGVDYVDDSKATNAHAAAASLQAFPHVVWVAGGLAKGGEFDELVDGAADRLRGAVLMGPDRALVAEALARHAPEIPVVEVAGTDTGAMDDVVRAAAALARPGDTVLLAPACASMDMFRDYAERGDAFAAAVRRLPGVRPGS